MLSAEEIDNIHAYWRAANYLSVGQIYLLDNPLLKVPLTLEHIKPRLLGHWGTTPGLNFIYAHMNRLIKTFDLNAIFMAGPGHGGPAVVANTYLEGSYTELYPEVTRDEKGLQKLFKQFSFPGGIPSHASPETPGSIHEGGELGYVISHAYGAVFDNPGLFVCCVVGDGEAETGALATSWHSNKFLNPKTDGVVLPILHLNGYKIASPTVLARISSEELMNLFSGYGYKPLIVEGSDPHTMHQLMAEALDQAMQEIKAIKGSEERPRWPMIILKTPKGWTGPKEVDGKPVEGTWRSHQVPIADFKNPEHLKQLEEWLKSYHAEELFDEAGTFKASLAALAPKGLKRMGKSPYANGGLLLKDLKLPSIKDYNCSFGPPGKTMAESARLLGGYLKEVMILNKTTVNFRVFGPDETSSNRLGALFETTNRTFEATILPSDDHLAHDGRVMEVLSEHLCQGWLEGYLLTGRHGFFSCYEAFSHIVDSMFNQHAKWIKVSKQVAWRKPIASLNYFLTSHVWRQDHNGFSHQDPGFIDHVCNKKAEIIRVYLPPDANTLISVTDHCLRSRNYINVIVAGKHADLQYLTMEEAVTHCAQGASIWPWASHEGDNPDLVMVGAGDVPTQEMLAATTLLREHLPSLKIRVVNVVDLMVLQPDSVHPHGLSDKVFDALFTKDKPVIFAYHGYPTLIHRFIYRRTNYANFHVHGYQEEGTTTTPFDMAVLNGLDRFHLVKNALSRLKTPNPALTALMDEKLAHHKAYIRERGEDLPEIRNWIWPY